MASKREVTRITICSGGKEYPADKTKIVRIERESMKAVFVTFGYSVPVSHIYRRLPGLLDNPDYRKTLRKTAYYS